VDNNTTNEKIVHKLTKQISVYNNIQFVNNVFFKQFAVFSECRSFVKNLSFLLYIASDTEQSKNVIHSLAT